MDSSDENDSVERPRSALYQELWRRKEREDGDHGLDRVGVPPHPGDPQDDGPGDGGTDSREPAPAMLSGIESVHDEANPGQQFIGTLPKAIKPRRLTNTR